MSNLAMKLDTLSYSKKLIEAGCERKLAEVHASLQQDTLVEISENYLSQFATKQDIKDLNISQFATKQDLKDLDTKFSVFEQKMTNLVLKMTITLGGLVVAGVIVLAAIIKL